MVLFLHITTRIEGRKDEKLLSEVGGNAFPYLVAMDEAGKVVAKHEGPRTAEGFRKTMKSGQEFVDLRAKAGKGDPVAQVEFFIRSMMLGDIKELEAAKKESAKLKHVTKEQQARIDDELLKLEVAEVLKPVHENRDRNKIQELNAAAGRTFLEMHKKGRVPKAERLFGDFYSAILVAAEVDKDIPTFEEALKLLEERFPQATKFFEAKRQILEKLKAEKEPEKK